MSAQDDEKRLMIKNPNRSFGFLIQDVGRLMRRRFNRRIQETELGLTSSQWQALVHIYISEGLSQTALADLLDTQPITVARLIDRMEAAGWVERRADPNDRRAFKLYLKEKAKPALEKMAELSAEVRAESTVGLSKQEKDMLLGVLQKMRANLCSSAGCSSKS